jgi:ribonucleoside-diphosphate reductase alpha chain
MAVQDEYFDNDLSAQIWRTRYRYAAAGSAEGESSIRDTWQRVANAVASVESSNQGARRGEYLELLKGFRFLPGGRILASAGTARDATLFNCFVMGPIDDSMSGIFERLRESALTMQKGGGIGCDFSTLRPAGSRAMASGTIASGPVSFMHLWDSMCATLLSQGNRRGAMMGTLRCDHPDIVEFVTAKRTPGALGNFNLSVQVTDDFLRAVETGGSWDLRFPADGGEVLDTLRATDLWRDIASAAHASAEPGVLFVDRINRENNLYYREHITATNPCGEVPLPAFGACNLGSINLAAHVRDPFSPTARLDLDAIGKVTRSAIRFLDAVIDLSPFPLEAQASEARATRRIGLGVTGLADALIMLGLRYDSDAGRGQARVAVLRIRDEAYRASIDLAREKGPFPALDQDACLSGHYIASLPAHLRDGIAAHGIRNSHLLAIAPTGSISLLANNLSSGIEPVFAPRMERIVRGPDGEPAAHDTVDHACALWSRSGAAGVPPACVSAREVSPEDHLLMAAALQPLIDQSISKTVNVPEQTSPEDIGAIYTRAYELGLKGCTVFRENSVRGSIITTAGAEEPAPCCPPENLTAR